MAILLQTVVVEDSGFNEIWAGVFTLLGAIVGVVGAVVTTLLINRHARNLERDAELRQWRLEQLRPTVELANRSLVHFAEIDEAHRMLFLDESFERLEEFTRNIRSEAFLFRDLGHSVIVARPGAEDIQGPLFEFIQSYSECMADILNAIEKNLAANVLDLPRLHLRPSKSSHDRLMDAVLALNQATERYAFGVVGPPTLAELEKMQTLLQKAELQREGGEAQDSPLPV